MILKQRGYDYRVVSKIMGVRPPVRVRGTRTNGWHDLSVRVQEGGIVHAYEAKLPFNGKSYPISPTTPAVQPLRTETSGQIVVPTSDTVEPLYPLV